MPMPKPKAGETIKKFLARFLASKAMKKEYPDHKQRKAVAYSVFKRAKKN